MVSHLVEIKLLPSTTSCATSWIRFDFLVSNPTIVVSGKNLFRMKQALLNRFLKRVRRYNYWHYKWGLTQDQSNYETRNYLLPSTFFLGLACHKSVDKAVGSQVVKSTICTRPLTWLCEGGSFGFYYVLI